MQSNCTEKQIGYRLLIEKRAARLIAKGKRQFRNRVILEKEYKNSLSVKLELAPDDFLELTIKWQAFKNSRKVMPTTFIQFVLFVLLSSYEDNYFYEKDGKKFLLFEGKAPSDFFIGMEKLLSGVPSGLKRFPFKKILKEAGYGR